MEESKNDEIGFDPSPYGGNTASSSGANSCEEIRDLMRGSIALYRNPYSAADEKVSLENFKILKLLGKGA